MLLKKNMSTRWASWIAAIFAAVFLLLAAKAASAAPCDFKANPPPFIGHDLTNS